MNWQEMTPFQQGLLTAAFLWLLILGASFLYARSRKDPNRTTLNAFLVFIGYFIGLGLLPVVVLVGIVDKVFAPTEIVTGIIGLAMLVVLVYMWRLARSTIQKDSAPLGIENPPPDC